MLKFLDTILDYLVPISLAVILSLLTTIVVLLSIIGIRQLLGYL